MRPSCPRCYSSYYMEPQSTWSRFSTTWVCRKRRLVWRRGWFFYRQVYRECGMLVTVMLPIEEW